MKIPDDNHPITITPAPGVVRALFEGHEIADSANVLVLREANYPPVYYFPRDDVWMIFLRRTDKVSHCPYKGDASYFTIYRDRKIVDNAAWSYEDPFGAVAAIAGRVAFYPEHVDFEVGERTAADTQASDVDAVVQHTDSGAGTSQAEHWPPNVDGPDASEDDVDKPYKDIGTP
jgi:uncharacterized protein (DUF427 family)